MINTYKILVGKSEGKETTGWEDNIKINLK
jgi:hypothetical protein